MAWKDAKETKALETMIENELVACNRVIHYKGYCGECFMLQKIRREILRLSTSPTRRKRT